MLAIIKDMLVQQLGPFGPAIALAVIGLFVFLLILPVILARKNDPLRKLEEKVATKNAKGQGREVKLRTQGKKNKTLDKYSNFLEPKTEEELGEVRLKLFGDPAVQQSVARREAQVMIRHPNYSGLQRDQITQLFVSAHFISALEVRQGDDVLFSLEGGISISENPVFRFWYSDNGSPALTVRAVDTDGNVFQQDLPKMPPA